MAHVKREQLAAIGIHYIYYPVDYMLDSHKEAGYTTIELLGQAPHFLMDHQWNENPSVIKQKAADRGLTIGCFTPECAVYPYRTCAADPDDHRRCMDYFKRGIKVAEELGATKLLTNAIGGVLDEDYDIAYGRAVETFQELGPVAADHGVTIAVETVRPEESLIVTRLPELERLLADVDHPNIKAGLDTVAMGVAGETPRQWFETLGDAIVHTHFVDGRPYGHLVWGDGLYPLESYLSVLNEFGYEGLLGAEITDGRYFDDPAEADRRNFKAFEPYLEGTQL